MGCQRTHFPRAGTYIPEVLAQMKRLGLRFEEPCSQALGYLHVELPPGWSIGIEADSPILSVTDAHGRGRVQLTPFEFEPNSGFSVLAVRLSRFYERWVVNETGPNNSNIFTLQLKTANGNTVLERTWFIPYPLGSVMYYIMEDRIYTQFKKWLREVFPECDDPFAYWDE